MNFCVARVRQEVEDFLGGDMGEIGLQPVILCPRHLPLVRSISSGKQLRLFAVVLSTFTIITPLMWMFSLWHRSNSYPLLGAHVEEHVLLPFSDTCGISRGYISFFCHALSMFSVLFLLLVSYSTPLAYGDAFCPLAELTFGPACPGYAVFGSAFQTDQYKIQS
ncbi:hypothetical protein QBC35DRAFT_501535 [Podospora australis]|uniref:Uncharacterized protein n=1 Tax=Podospora australis TaxID=1536484 RepID=A0AAN7AHN1_9PEZI|nr:hypothetical protein QBC35DRAFT_501535 [Podospora australis]